MEVVVTTGAVRRTKLQSNHHHQQTNTQFFTGRMPFLSPNQQCQSTEGKHVNYNESRITAHLSCGFVWSRITIIFFIWCLQSKSKLKFIPKIWFRDLNCESSGLHDAPEIAHQLNVQREPIIFIKWLTIPTRSSADADNRLDAFSGQSRSTNMVPFHMLHIVSYCAIVTLSLRYAVFTIFVFKKFHDLEMGVKGHSRSLRVVSFDRLCMVSY